MIGTIRKRYGALAWGLLVLLGATASCRLTSKAAPDAKPLVAAQTAADQRGPAGDQGRPLTEAQAAQVKTILAGYDQAMLTADQAKAIHNAFRLAGIPGGSSLNDAVRAAGWDPDRLRDLAPPPDRTNPNGNPPPDRPGLPGRGPADRQGPRPGGQGQYSIEQAVSDRAQLSTIAFDGLAFLTGDFGCNTFIPPGKVADYCGFQYMRDVDTSQLGHNTSFVPRAANTMLSVLTDAQKAKLIALAKEQEAMLNDFAVRRFPLVKAFTRQMNGDTPAGRPALSREAVMKYTADLYAVDGQLSYRRAEVLGSVIRSLTDQQRAALAKMVFNNSSTWPEQADQFAREGLSKRAHVAAMTYASELFSWYAGNVEADTYFCPERHATYFGSFFMKDIPAMGNAGYSISTSLTGDSGEAFLAALTDSQRALVTNLVEQQRVDLAEIVKTRRAVAAELRRFQKEPSADKAKVMALSRRYGELDGEISYLYTMAFTQVARTLTPDQKQTLLKLRNLDPKFAPKGAFMYSDPIAMPQVPNTDFLFGTAAAEGKPVVTPVAARSVQSGFVLKSPEVADGGTLPKDYTGDGSASTLPLSWSGAPGGTKSFALIMHHVAPDTTKTYWVLYDIPATIRGLAKNAANMGRFGRNSINDRLAYAPPHSKGPGAKTYILTLYALSAAPKLSVPPDQVTRDVLLAAMNGHTLATAQLKVVYSRPEGTGGATSERRAGNGEPGGKA